MNDDSFFSINRLVEFGMGMSIAQQMIKTMNESMTNMHVPGSVEVNKPKLFYALIEDNQIGPLSESEMSKLISNKKVFKETYVWTPGMGSWDMVENVPEVLKLVALSPPPINQKK